jgi:hypothetical protein
MLDKCGERKLQEYHFASAGKVITTDRDSFKTLIAPAIGEVSPFGGQIPQFLLPAKRYFSSLFS